MFSNGGGGTVGGRSVYPKKFFSAKFALPSQHTMVVSMCYGYCGVYVLLA